MDQDFQKILLRLTIVYLIQEKGELRNNGAGERTMLEEIFVEIMGSQDGDYVTQALVLAEMKPAGW